MNHTRQTLLESLLRRLCPQRLDTRPELAEAIGRWRLEHFESETVGWRPFVVEGGKKR